MDSDWNPIGRAVFTIGTAAGVVLGIWMSVIALIGGTMPLFGWEVEGGFGDWLLWTAVIIPIMLTVLYWALLLVASVLGGAGRPRD